MKKGGGMTTALQPLPRDLRQISSTWVPTFAKANSS